MVKKLSTLLIAVLAITGASAQHAAPKSLFSKQKKNAASWQKIMEQQRTSNSTAKTTTGSGQKLLAIAGREMGALSDTTHYSWSGNRTLEHYVNPAQIIDYGEYYGLDEDYAEPFGFSYRYPKLKADSIYNYYDDGGLQLQLSSGVVNTYNSADMLTKSETLEASWQRNYTDITYNANGKVVSAINYVDTTMSQNGSYLLYSSVYCSYDNNNWLTKDSIIHHLYAPPGSYSLNVFQKNAIGKDTAISHYENTDLNQVVRYAYNASGLLQTAKHYNYFSGTYELSFVDSFGYSGTITYPAYYSGIYSLSGGPIGYGNTEHSTFNANGDIASQLFIDYNTDTQTWDTSARYDAYYNSSDNADSLVADEYDNDNGVWLNDVFKYHFYYDQATSIAPIIKATSLNIYPNPTTDVMHLAVADVTTTDAGTVSITDAAGRLVRQLSFRGNAISIPTASLPIGIYHLQYQSGNKQGASTFVKQ